MGGIAQVDNKGLVPQQPFNKRNIIRRDIFQFTQLTLSLGRLLRQDVIPEGLPVLVAFGSFLKPLGCTTIGFHFGHFHTPHSKVSLMVSPLQTNSGTARKQKEQSQRNLSLDLKKPE